MNPLDATPIPTRVALVTRWEHDVDETTWLQYLLDVATAISEEWLRIHPGAPGVLDAGLVFRREPRGTDDTADHEERFLTYPSLLIAGGGDCDDIAPCRAAELRVRHGIRARAVPIVSPIGYHIIVEYPDGTTEDPSIALGMKGF